jgi:hypothetical protein
MAIARGRLQGAPVRGRRVAEIVNSKGWVYDARNTAEKKRGSDWNLEGLKVAAAVSPPGKEACWSVEMAVPFAVWPLAGSRFPIPVFRR